MKTFTLSLYIAVLAFLGCAKSPEESKQQGFDLYDQNNYVSALPLLEKAYDGNIDDPELVVRLAFCRVTVNGDALSAIKILQQSVLQNPNYARTYFELGYISQNFGPKEDNQNILQAMVFTRKAIELDSMDYKTKDNLGMMHFKLNNLDSAEYWFGKASELYPSDSSIYKKLIQIDQLKAIRAAADSASVSGTDSSLQ